MSSSIQRKIVGRTSLSRLTLGKIISERENKLVIGNQIG